MSAGGQRLNYQPALDGVRALAITGVVLSHIRFPWFRNGAFGVDIFFCLSGFLITTLLLEEIDDTGSIHLLKFWGRRALRLFPALALVMVAVLLYVHHGPASVEAAQTKDAARSVAFYVVNWRLVTTHHDIGLFGPFWSLAVEEQFYVVWPLVMLGALKVWGNEAINRRMTVVCVVAALASLVARVALFDGLDNYWRMFGTDVNADALLWGCGLAFALPLLRTERARPALRRVSAFLLWPSIATLLYFAQTLHPSESYRTIATFGATWGIGIVAVCTAVMIVRVLVAPRAGLASLLRAPVLVGLGPVSYSLYLWHILVFRIVAQHGPFHSAWSVGTASVVGAVAVSALSYYAVERPLLRRFKRYVTPRKLPTAQALPTSS